MTTTIYLLRYGEVHNPEGIIYGRLPGYRLNEARSIPLANSWPSVVPSTP
jgi:hypothetical protein